MNMTPRLRKFALFTHVTFSVGWFGAIFPYLALAVAGLVSHDVRMIRAAYLSMELIGWFVIVPFSLAALTSGLVQSLGTPWGLFRHWWIVAKFVLTIVATLVLLRHMAAVSSMARLVTDATTTDAGLRAQGVGLVVHPTGGLLVLLAVMLLSVMKPWGLTAYGRRRVSQPATARQRADEAIAVHEPLFAIPAPRWPKLIKIHAIHAVVLLLLFLVVLHLSGGAMPHH